MSTFSQWAETLSHLRPEQAFYRLYHPLKKTFYRSPSVPEAALRQAQQHPVTLLATFPEGDHAIPEQLTFHWLNRPLRFSQPSWYPSGLGALWDYHLHAFTWLERQPGASPAVLRLLESRAAADDAGIGDDPYPSSLRLTAAVRWLLRGAERPDGILSLLYRDAHRIAAFPERHLLGNHLLENAIGLFHGGRFFAKESWLRQAADLLRTELAAQFLPDGAHIERSISYHARLIAGLLKCLQLLRALPAPSLDALDAQLRSTIARGLGWLQAMQFPEGGFPAFGDSQPEPLPDRYALVPAAAALGIHPVEAALQESGYRKLQGSNWTLFANAGNASPDYQPGHAHADALSFCLNADGAPLVVDTGISTYERNTERLRERGTAAHNTVCINETDSADVWASFRMGRRARVQSQWDASGILSTSHDGYRRQGLIHHRRFQAANEELVITDRIEGRFRTAEAFLHFHPDAAPRLVAGGELEAGASTVIRFEGFGHVHLEPYVWCAGFNLRRPALRLRASFHGPEAAFRFRF